MRGEIPAFHMKTPEIKLTSLDPVVINEWTFKVSTCAYNGSICVIAHNPMVMWSNVRFFYNENEAKNWIEYLSLQVSKTK